MEKILFICTNNSARSQIAEGYLKHTYGTKYDVYSAGTEPTTVNPWAIKVMDEIGIDISNHRSKDLPEFEGMEFDHIITVCGDANKTCPFFPGGKKYTHKKFRDPVTAEKNKDEKIKIFREVRDEITSWINKEFQK